MPRVKTRARNDSTHWANGCAADWANARSTKVAETAPPSAEVSKVLRSKSMRPVYRRIVAGILPPPGGIWYRGDKSQGGTHERACAPCRHRGSRGGRGRRRSERSCRDQA